MTFDFTTPERIVFGIGCIRKLPGLVQPWGRKALVVVGRSMNRTEPHIAALSEAGMEVTRLQVEGEPTVDAVRQGAERARCLGTELVIGIGGGSVIDTGKAIAGLAPNPGDPVDYLEVIGAAKPLPHPPLPFAAVPTTAGTGSEATRNAVLSSPQHRVKVSLRSPLMWPRLALVDPFLTVGLPAPLTAATGLDALTQLLEAFVSVRANPMTDILCRHSLPRVASALPRAFEDGTFLEARKDLALGALHSGMALANAGLGAVHGLAGPLGGRCGAPHGALCAALLAPVTAANIQALRQRDPECPSLERYAEVSRCLGAETGETPEALVGSLQRLVSRLGIPGLTHWGVTTADLGDLIRKAQDSSSMKGNPIRLTDSELHGVLHEAL
jgi:alcohol dehydrogenase class IV